MGVRITQEVVEVLGTSDPNSRITQEFVEVLGTSARNARITQQVVEVLCTSPRNARITQQVVLFLYVPLDIGPGFPGVIGIGSDNTSAEMIVPMTPQVSVV